MDKQAIIIFTHFWNDFVEEKYNEIKSTLDTNCYDLFVSLNTDEEDFINSVPGDVNLAIFRQIDFLKFKDMGYKPICSRLLPGSCHYPMLKFWQDNQKYTHYWFIEYDVDFSGDWSYLFDTFNFSLKDKIYDGHYSPQVEEDYDFLSCYVQNYGENNNESWSWWYDSNNMNWPIQDCVKGFNPICRYSYRALFYIHAFQKMGFSAHSEVLITTALAKSNHKLGNFSNEGLYGIKSLKEPFYISEGNVAATMRYRPLIRKHDYKFKNMIYHPVKK